MVTKEVEEIINYSYLKVELEKMWNTTVKVIPVGMEHWGLAQRNFHNSLTYLKIKYGSNTTKQKDCFLGTAHILRKVLFRTKSQTRMRDLTRTSSQF